MRYSTSLLITFAALAAAREVPSNLQAFYNSHINGNCDNPVSIDYKSGQDSKADTVYCSDEATKTLYVKANGKAYADMDIDCDGSDDAGGACGDDPSGQSETAFKDTVTTYGISDLDAHVHTYVVLGNDNSPSEGDGGESYTPKTSGIEPLSIVAVVCKNQLVYGVWGDVNGGVSTGEASVSLAQICFPSDGISGDNGHTEKDVLYIAFEGKDAVPGKDGADWKAQSKEEFEGSLAKLGDQLVAGIGGTGANGTLANSRIMRRSYVF